MDDYESLNPQDTDLQISCGLHSEMSAQGVVSGAAPNQGRDAKKCASACKSASLRSNVASAMDATPEPRRTPDLKSRSAFSRTSSRWPERRAAGPMPE